MVEPRAGVMGKVLQADADLAGALGCLLLRQLHRILSNEWFNKLRGIASK